MRLPPPARGRLVATRAAASAASSTSGDDADDVENADGEQRPNLLEQIWLRLVKPLRDFGFGRTNIWEGGVGLFLLGGLSIAALAVNWVMGVNFNKMRSYQAFVEFPFACGIQVGTQVRVRGVKVGNVLSVRPNLERVEVLVEMDDDGIVIPRNSLVEANQSGLIAETIIDITPEVPIPDAQWGPLDSGCEGEGLVVCDRGKIVGVPGVSMDELVGICTKLAREMDAQKGLAKMFATAETAQDLMKNLEPLLLEAAEIGEGAQADAAERAGAGDARHHRAARGARDERRDGHSRAQAHHPDGREPGDAATVHHHHDEDAAAHGEGERGYQLGQRRPGDATEPQAPHPVPQQAGRQVERRREERETNASDGVVARRGRLRRGERRGGL